MKKLWLFLFSTLIAFGIAFYSKKAPTGFAQQKPAWKTYQKKSSREISAHPTTHLELEQARIPMPRRDIAQVKSEEKINLPKDRAYQLREGRLLIGDISKGDFQDEQVDLDMVNKVNPDWKNILGNDLLRFQEEETKVMIREELPVIKIQNGKGQYLEQVLITYVFKNGNYSSYHALVDSDTGFVTETWDRTIHEKVKPERAEIALPEINNSGIIAR